MLKKVQAIGHQGQDGNFVILAKLKVLFLARIR
jgi:hypothetical protein